MELRIDPPEYSYPELELDFIFESDDLATGDKVRDLCIEFTANEDCEITIDVISCPETKETFKMSDFGAKEQARIMSNAEHTYRKYLDSGECD